MSNKIQTQVSTLAASISVAVSTEQTIASNGIVYASYKKEKINLAQLTVAYSVYKSVKAALEVACSSMDIQDLNKWAHSVTQNLSEDDVEAFVSDVSSFIRSRRDYAINTHRCVLNFDKPFEGLCLSVAKKPKGGQRNKTALFEVGKVQANSSLDKFKKQNELADALLSNDGTFAFASEARELQAQIDEQDLLILESKPMVLAKIKMIMADYDEVMKARADSSVESTHTQNDDDDDDESSQSHESSNNSQGQSNASQNSLDDVSTVLSLLAKMGVDDLLAIQDGLNFYLEQQQNNVAVAA